jgi:hypothetical protein
VQADQEARDAEYTDRTAREAAAEAEAQAARDARYAAGFRPEPPRRATQNSTWGMGSVVCRRSAARLSAGRAPAVSPVRVEAAGRREGRACAGDVLGVRVRSGAERRTLCSDECAEDYRRAMGRRRPAVEAATRAVGEPQREAAIPAQRVVKTLPQPEGKALHRWYTEELQARLSRIDPAEIVRGTAVQQSYAHYIVAGTRVPHPRHYPNLAARWRRVARKVCCRFGYVRLMRKSGHSANVACASTQRRKLNFVTCPLRQRMATSTGFPAGKLKTEACGAAQAYASRMSGALNDFI